MEAVAGELRGGVMGPLGEGRLGNSMSDREQQVRRPEVGAFPGSPGPLLPQVPSPRDSHQAHPLPLAPPAPPSGLPGSLCPPGCPCLSLPVSLGTWEFGSPQTLPPPGTRRFQLAQCPLGSPQLPGVRGTGDRSAEVPRGAQGRVSPPQSRNEGSLKVEQGRGGPGPGPGGSPLSTTVLPPGKPRAPGGRPSWPSWLPAPCEGALGTGENSKVETESN